MGSLTSCLVQTIHTSTSPKQGYQWSCKQQSFVTNTMHHLLLGLGLYEFRKILKVLARLVSLNYGRKKNFRERKKEKTKPKQAITADLPHTFAPLEEEKRSSASMKIGRAHV